MTMDVLHHIMDCKYGLECAYPHCTNVKICLNHWDSCNSEACQVCNLVILNHYQDIEEETKRNKKLLDKTSEAEQSAHHKMAVSDKCEAVLKRPKLDLSELTPPASSSDEKFIFKFPLKNISDLTTTTWSTDFKFSKTTDKLRDNLLPVTSAIAGKITSLSNEEMNFDTWFIKHVVSMNFNVSEYYNPLSTRMRIFRLLRTFITYLRTRFSEDMEECMSIFDPELYLIQHMLQCSNMKNCNFPQCFVSKLCLYHYIMCEKKVCELCVAITNDLIATHEKLPEFDASVLVYSESGLKFNIEDIYYGLPNHTVFDDPIKKGGSSSDIFKSIDLTYLLYNTPNYADEPEYIRVNFDKIRKRFKHNIPKKSEVMGKMCESLKQPFSPSYKHKDRSMFKKYDHDMTFPAFDATSGLFKHTDHSMWQAPLSRPTSNKLKNNNPDSVFEFPKHDRSYNSFIHGENPLSKYAQCKPTINFRKSDSRRDIVKEAECKADRFTNPTTKSSTISTFNSASKFNFSDKPFSCDATSKVCKKHGKPIKKSDAKSAYFNQINLAEFYEHPDHCVYKTSRNMGKVVSDKFESTSSSSSNFLKKSDNSEPSTNDVSLESVVDTSTSEALNIAIPHEQDVYFNKSTNGVNMLLVSNAQKSTQENDNDTRDLLISTKESDTDESN